MEVLTRRTDETRTVVRAQLIRAAAEAILLQGDDIAVSVAATDTAKFVRAVRKTYKAEGFNFSDDDLREIQLAVRGLCVRKGLHNRRVLSPDEAREQMRLEELARKQAKEMARPQGPRFVTSTPDGQRVESDR